MRFPRRSEADAEKFMVVLPFSKKVAFPGLPLHHSIHAEQFLVTNLSLHSEPQLLSFAVSAAPCGHCRQFLQELPFAPNITLNILDNTNTFTPLSHFLFHHFGPHDLLIPKDTLLLLQHHHNNLTLITATHNLSSPIDLTLNGFPSNPDSNSKFQSLDSGYSSTTPTTTNPNNNDNNDDKLLKVETLEAATSNSNEGVNGYAAKDDFDSNKLLKEAALEAGNKSHAPYSGSPSGVALMDNEGKIYKGSYLESVAYNPSLGLVQTALVAFVAGGGGGYDQIVEAVLVEKDGAI
ncbi:hypothetical protein RIF29_17525 [Crotalaria pallida]|uniref:CMP/dCMP-type deaminase domain-containing protein n=1 Tax=Crotalaria pallida TaxID=3830 RepID=A0AAN9IKF3_CROPI